MESHKGTVMAITEAEAATKRELSWTRREVVMATAQLTLIDVSIKNILVATDFWPHSKAAFWFAASLAKRYDAILHTAHILAPARS